MSDRFDDSRSPGGMSAGVSVPLHQSRVLLIDGEDSTRFRVASDFKQAGASVDFAGSGPQAVLCVLEAQDAQDPYDLVVLDLSGMGGDGCDVAEQLRDAHFAGPILALGDKATKRESARCIDAGCDDLLSKHEEPSVLIKAAVLMVNDEKVRRFGLAGPDAVTSELSAYPDLLMMLRRFVSNLPESIESVLSAQREQDLNRLREELDRVKRNATSHGYLEIRASAVSAQSELDHSKKPDAQGVVDALDELADLCQRATASPSEPPPPSGPPLPPSG